jgi:hypothetical protein
LVPGRGALLVEGQTGQGSVNGCLGEEEMRRGECPLYDEEGNVYGTFTFRSKSIANYTMQT